MSPIRSITEPTHSMQALFYKWGQILLFSMVNGAAILLAIRLSWSLFTGEVFFDVRDSLGVVDLEAQTTEIQTTINVLSTTLDAHTQLLDSIDRRLTPPIAHYDESRSEVITPCFIGFECTAEFWTWRDKHWAHCGVPVVTHYEIEDQHGVTREARRGPENRAQKQGSTKTPIRVNFIPPETSTPGFAEFYMKLEYLCGDTVEAHTTARLAFTLRSPLNEPD